MITEKQQIEQATVEAFLNLYNQRLETDFKVTSFADEGTVPDAACKNTNGDELNIEVTMTEDMPMDIQSLLGRSEHKSVEAVRARLDRVKAGLEPIWYSSLDGNVLDQIVDRISKKWRKRYGPNTALVIRDASPLPWSWDSVVDKVRSRLDLSSTPFDRGIWILNYDKSLLYEIHSGSA
jgi:hypothetical protein